MFGHGRAMRDQVTISIDPGLREAVREIANQERRTLSAQICHILAATVAQQERNRRKPVASR